MISINYRDGKPIFEQVKSGFRSLIISGAMPDGEKMPSVRELASQLAINPNTIQRAYRELEAEGYICSVPGLGSFVNMKNDTAEKRKKELLEQLRVLAAELKLANAAEEEVSAIIKEEYEHD